MGGRAGRRAGGWVRQGWMCRPVGVYVYTYADMDMYTDMHFRQYNVIQQSEPSFQLGFGHAASTTSSRCAAVVEALMLGASVCIYTS